MGKWSVPTVAVALVVSAAALRQLGRVDEAIAELREAIQIQPELSTARGELEAVLAEVS
jgi:Flp pilus assembly protein TadD